MTIPKPYKQGELKFTFKFSHWGLYVSKITNAQGQIFIYWIGEEKFLWSENEKCYISTTNQHQLYYTHIFMITVQLIGNTLHFSHNEKTAKLEIDLNFMLGTKREGTPLLLLVQRLNAFSMQDFLNAVAKVSKVHIDAGKLIENTDNGNYEDSINYLKALGFSETYN